MAKSWGSRSIELFENLEQVGEGTVRRQRKESFSTLFPPGELFADASAPCHSLDSMGKFIGLRTSKQEKPWL